VIERPPQLTPIEKKRTYEAGMHASGYSGNNRACWNVVSSSDGMNFSLKRVSYHSSKRAYRELQKNLKQAIEVITREPTFDEQGRQIGEQVLATFEPYEGSSVVSARLLWTDDSDFGYVESSSLENILEYEKDHGR
jgi:hypothetical protein